MTLKVHTNELMSRSRMWAARIRKHFRYGNERKDLLYYRQVLELAGRYAGKARSALDVGSYDTDLLTKLTWIQDRTALDLRVKPRLPGVTGIKSDFMKFQADGTFDLVLCLQVLEHLENPVAFMNKLLLTGKIVIVSVPYNWPEHACPTHLQDPVDESKLLEWAGTAWAESVVVTEENGVRRLVAVWGSGGDA